MFPIDWGGTRTADNPMYGSHQIQQQSGLIVREEAAMWTALADTGGYDFATGVAPFPQTTLPQRPSQSPDLMSLYISRRAANPLGCWEWFKFLSAQPDAFPGLPIRRSVSESQGWEASVGNETAAAYRESLSRPTQPLPDLEDPYFGTAYPYTLWWSDALQEVFTGSSPTAVLEEMQRRADSYRACISRAPSLSSEEATACALEADPGFQRP